MRRVFHDIPLEDRSKLRNSIEERAFMNNEQIEKIVREKLGREVVAKWLWDMDRKEGDAVWPPDYERQPYCQSTLKDADYLLKKIAPALSEVVRQNRDILEMDVELAEDLRGILELEKIRSANSNALIGKIQRIVNSVLGSDTRSSDYDVLDQGVLEAIESAKLQAHAEAIVSDEQIKYMASRFLQWRLPENFNPDGGISFKKTYNEHAPWGPMKHEPVGTNLLDATQAEEMVRYITAELPPVNPTLARIEAELRTAEARLAHSEKWRLEVARRCTISQDNIHEYLPWLDTWVDSDRAAIANLRRERDAEIERQHGKR